MKKYQIFFYLKTGSFFLFFYFYIYSILFYLFIYFFFFFGGEIFNKCE